MPLLGRLEALLPPRGRFLKQLAGREFEEQKMEADDRIELEGAITTSHPFSTTSGMRAPQSQFGHARPHITGSRLAVGEGKALKGKGWLR
jgi:hypothetical protein